jgi:hypothetical protein
MKEVLESMTNNKLIGKLLRFKDLKVTGLTFRKGNQLEIGINLKKWLSLPKLWAKREDRTDTSRATPLARYSCVRLGGVVIVLPA